MQNDLARIWNFEASDQSQQCAFTAARWPLENGRPPGRYFQVDVLQGDDISKKFTDLRNVDHAYFDCECLLSDGTDLPEKGMCAGAPPLRTSLFRETLRMAELLRLRHPFAPGEKDQCSDHSKTQG